VGSPLHNDLQRAPDALLDLQLRGAPHPYIKPTARRVHLSPHAAANLATDAALRPPKQPQQQASVDRLEEGGRPTKLHAKLATRAAVAELPVVMNGCACAIGSAQHGLSSGIIWAVHMRPRSTHASAYTHTRTHTHDRILICMRMTLAPSFHARTRPLSQEYDELLMPRAPPTPPAVRGSGRMAQPLQHTLASPDEASRYGGAAKSPPLLGVPGLQSHLRSFAASSMVLRPLSAATPSHF
jgi:hypothetical protein